MHPIPLKDRAGPSKQYILYNPYKIKYICIYICVCVYTIKLFININVNMYRSYINVNCIHIHIYIPTCLSIYFK